MLRLYKEPQWRSLKATLFGKFYESIVAGYFRETLGFNVYDRNIAIPVNYLEDLDEKELMRRVEDLVKEGKIDRETAEAIVNRLVKALNEAKTRGRKRYNPDLVLEKNGKYYVVEMQVWPVWTGSRYGSSGFSWKVIENEGVALIPRVLATKVKVGGMEVPVSGFYYVAYRRGPEHSNIEDFFKAITTREFKLFYMDEIVRECHSYDWYRDIIQNVRKHVNNFLEDLERGDIEKALSAGEPVR